MALDPVFKARWVAALRSGEYAQGHGSLRIDSTYYCCLGVACDLVGPEGWVGDLYHHGPMVGTSVLPRTLENELGIQYAGNFELPCHLRGPDWESDEHSLAELNDSGFTFDQIADVIDYFF